MAGIYREFPVICEDDSRWGYSVEKDVDWGDMDANEHVNNVQYIRWAQTARLSYFFAHNILQSPRRDGFGYVLAEINCKYQRPVFFPDVVTLRCRVAAIGKSSVHLEWAVDSKKHGRAATGTARMVGFDHKRQEKLDIPQDIIDVIVRVEHPRVVQRLSAAL
eukprot:TRINITY_DN2329_c0_g1_i3.p1 TRINITY_DN2329_c0_g1~~TRINITY_DN2329_c0_g1_i3.p1  ORF type:complete len:162 (-),score=32.32 TRINITY_DN2329_c0_g1_i3:193-678(-)